MSAHAPTFGSTPAPTFGSAPAPTFRRFGTTFSAPATGFQEEGRAGGGLFVPLKDLSESAVALPAK